LDPVRAQYEELPYPARDPRDEAKRLVTGSPSQVWELNHYVFAGRRDFAKPFRVLVAGGGTGDACVMLAQQLADLRSPAEIVYVDLSTASRAIAEARVKARGLANVSFHTLSILDLPEAGLGRFDYIDCSGVLHHLESPERGLAALVSVLADDGGIGLMLYGDLGRTGVYDVQEMLRAVAADGAPAARIALARRLLGSLPPTSRLQRNPFVSDHLKAGDPGLFDLLLHARDRAYRVPEIAALIKGAGLRLAGWAAPAAYDPLLQVRDPALRERLESLAPLERAAFAELLTGNLRKHVFYAIPASRGETVAAIAGDAVPVLVDHAPAELAAAIVARCDGAHSLDAIFAELAAADCALSRAGFDRQFAELYRAFNGIARLFLRFPPGG
jgi:SAM-dependent methyltransferase